ncbi:MBL fold metallo-hydrolase [Sandaracinobacteroides saxicola]|uniref:MBL fold metallo-hydrolase n=2 Tax=Sandaracinobacteroides saxicola TaxID=2759707 RepID=A0A7G5IMP5_9SPHN|nr:MBL fold metallo-hydrolase [Sandaracinobacteroides saxicola]
MPLPFSLDHINLWLLDDGASWAVVDTGVALTALKDHWRSALAGPLAGKPVGRVIVTHYHPDHLGLAGWLCRKYGVPLEMARAEYLLARTLTSDVRPAWPEEAIAFYARAGWPDADVEPLRQQNWGNFGRAVHALPAGYTRLREGQILTIGGRQWRLIMGSGHSPEHACLYSESDRILIAGDQLLPRITSNVSVYPTEPLADPLGDWLDSIDHLRQIDADTLVLPAHNEPFTRAHTRLDQLAADHHRKLDALESFCTEPRTAHASFETLFRRPVQPGELQMATGEALAHLHWLERRNRLRRLPDKATDRFIRS